MRVIQLDVVATPLEDKVIICYEWYNFRDIITTRKDIAFKRRRYILL
jgi:hypothetical protein